MQDTNDTDADNIFNTWHLYQKIVSFNNMFHREIYADVAQVLSKVGSGFSLLDLGCGDASNLVPVIARLPITHYCGVDLSQTALDLAKTNLNALSCVTSFHNTDLLQAVQDLEEQYDVIFTSFALHHLSLPQKEMFFKAAYSRIKSSGFLLMIDVVREEQQDLASYLNAYCTWLRKDWQGIDAQEKAIACQHIMENDFPETLSTLEKLTQQSGFVTCRPVSRYKWHRILMFQV